MKVNLGRFDKRGERRESVVKIHEWDVWEGCSTMAKILHPLLIEIKKDKRGVPGDFMLYVENETDEENTKRWEEARKNWEEALDKMIYSMWSLSTNYDGGIVYKEIYEGKTRKEKAKKRNAHCFNNSPLNENEEKRWELASQASREHFDRVQEGCELLGKYFQSLWT